MNLVLPLILLLFLGSFIEGLDSRSDDPDLMTMAVVTGAFDIFLEVWNISTTGISDEVWAVQPLTVFAPMSKAFTESLPKGLLPCLYQPENIRYLRSLLAYHIIPRESMDSKKFRFGTWIPTLSGETILIELTTDSTFVINEVAVIVEPDIVAGNGVIHAIDSVLIPPSIDVPALLQSCDSLESHMIEGRKTETPEMEGTSIAPTATPVSSRPTLTNVSTSSPTFNESIVSSVSDESDISLTMEDRTIWEIMGDKPNLQVLTAVFKMSGLTGLVDDTARSITLFAPTDEAFENLPREFVDCLLMPRNAHTLVVLLIHHILEGTHLIGDLDSGPVTTLSSESFTIESVNQITIDGVEVVISRYIEASNGIVHIIDRVLTPPSWNAESLFDQCSSTTTVSLTNSPTGVPTGNPNPLDIPTLLLTSRTAENFVRWLSGSELGDLLAAPNGPFTIFVPSNTAINALPDSLNHCLLNQTSSEALWVLLSYHIAEGSFSLSDMDGLSVLGSYGGESITISKLNGTFLLNNVTPITVGDVYAANGVIHGLSDVLIPPSTNVDGILELCHDGSSTPAPIGPVKSPDSSSSWSYQDSAVIWAVTHFIAFLSL